MSQVIDEKIELHDKNGICSVKRNCIIEEKPTTEQEELVGKLESRLTNGTSVHQSQCADRANRKIENINEHFVNNVQECSTDVNICKKLSDVSVHEACKEIQHKHSLDINDAKEEIKFISYESELQMGAIMKLIQKDLSEPYSIYTYRYFIHNWPKLCFLAMHNELCVGAIVCKLDVHRNCVKRGYIAMLAVDEKYRKRKVGSSLVRLAIQAMIKDNADEVVLETEITNKPALKLYENLGFVRDKRLFGYYLNGVDALRLKLWLRFVSVRKQRTLAKLLKTWIAKNDFVYKIYLRIYLALIFQWRKLKFMILNYF